MILRRFMKHVTEQNWFAVGLDGLVVLAIIFLIPGRPVHSQDTQNPKPNILVLTTGGTIASRSNAPMVDGPALVQAVPEFVEHANISVEEFSVIGSSKMTPLHWLDLSKRINALFSANTNFDGIVITHGTDTLEETTYFLNLTLKSDKPVIMTGSMRSSNEVSADGSANLINAVRVAGDKASIGKGVLVVLNENITAARDAWKTDNRRVDTFKGLSVGHIGAVDPDGVRFYHGPLQPHTSRSEFDISHVETLPQIPILNDFTGFDEALLKPYFSQKMDGLIIRTFAGGRMSAGMAAGLEKFQKTGIPIVVTSRVPGGRIVQAPNYAFPAVVSNGQQDNKARILLMLALTKASDIKDIQRIFDTY